MALFRRREVGLMKRAISRVILHNIVLTRSAKPCLVHGSPVPCRCAMRRPLCRYDDARTKPRHM
jgi:hypothetical protein